MLIKVEVLSEQGEMLELFLQDSDGDFLVKGIDGLDPTKANIISSPFALEDGEEYQGSRGEVRNVLMRLGYADRVGRSVQARRNLLYRFFMPKAKVTLRFHILDFPVVELVGYVESMDAAIFTKEPEVVVSILCLDSAFVDPNLKTYTDIGNPSVVKPIVYNGTVATGFRFKVTAPKPLSWIRLEQTFPNRPGLTFMIQNKALLAGESFELTTTSGEKKLLFKKGTNVTSALGAVVPNSDWLKLYPGQNNIQMFYNGTGTAPVPFTIEYLEKYGGL